MANLLEKASIILTPTAYSDGKMHSAKPIVSTNPSIGDFDFARASVATRVNEQGLIEEVASGLPRIDYTDGSGSWLLEPTATNLITQSEDFSNVAWGKTSLIATSTLDINPSGTGSAYKIITDSGVALNVGRILDSLLGLTPSVAYSYSVFAKKSELNSIRLLFDDGITISNRAEAVFNLNDGSISNIQNAGNFSGVTAKSVNYGNGWYRCTISSVINTTGEAQARVYNSDTTITTGDGAKGVLVYGAQLEENSYSTSYIKTIGTTQTRVADTATGSGSSTVINSTEGTLYLEIKGFENDASSRGISISDGTTSNRINLFLPSTQTQVVGRISSAGVTVADMIYTGITQTTFNKIAVKWKLNDFALWVNGVEVLTDSIGAVPIGLNVLSFNNAGAVGFLGKAKSVQVYTTALSDSELTSLTTI